MADQGPGADGFQYPLVPRACRLPSLHPERSACVPLTWNGGPLAIVVRGNRALAEAVRRAVGERIEAETFTDKQRGHARTAEHTPGGHIGRSVRRVEDPMLITGKGCYVDDIQLPGSWKMIVSETAAKRNCDSTLLLPGSTTTQENRIDKAISTPWLALAASARGCGRSRP